MKSTLRFSDNVRSMIQSHGNKVNGSLEPTSKSGWIDSLHFKYLKSLYSVNELGIVTFRNLRDLDLFVNRISYLLKNAYSPNSIVDNLFGCGCNKTFVSLYDTLEEKRHRAAENLFSVDNLDITSGYYNGFPYQLLFNARSEIVVGNTYYGRFTKDAYVMLKNYSQNRDYVQKFRYLNDEDDFKGVMNEIIPFDDVELFYPFNIIRDFETGYHFTMDGNNPDTIQLVVDNPEFHRPLIQFDNNIVKGSVVKMPSSFLPNETNRSGSKENVESRNITIVANFDHKLPIKLKRKAPHFSFFNHNLKTVNECNDQGNIDIKFVLAYFDDLYPSFYQNNSITNPPYLFKLKVKFDISLDPGRFISRIRLSLTADGGNFSDEGTLYDVKLKTFPLSQQFSNLAFYYNNFPEAELLIKQQDYENIVVNRKIDTAKLRLEVFDRSNNCKVFIKDVKIIKKELLTGCCIDNQWEEQHNKYYGEGNMLRMRYTAVRQNAMSSTHLLISKTELHKRHGWIGSWQSQDADYCTSILDGYSSCDSYNLIHFYIHADWHNSSWSEALHSIANGTRFQLDKVKHFFATAYGGGSVNETKYYPNNIPICRIWI